MLGAATVVALVTALAACGGGGGSAPTTASPVPDDSAAVMAAAVHRLVSRDHTFGQGSHRFSEYLVLDHTDPGAGAPEGGADAAARPLTADERVAIAEVLAPFGPHRFIGDADEWRTGGGVRPTREGAVIVGVGPPAIDGATATVPVSLWCGNLCGTWLTYRLVRDGDAWRVTGNEGPVAIS